MITALVLAAGEGTRLGGPKALARLGGRTFVERAVSTCAASLVDEIVVVLGAAAEAVRAAVPSMPLGADVPVRCVLAEDWREGRTRSLQRGWAAVDPACHVVLYPVDHPAVRATTLDLLAGVFGYAAASPDVVVPVLVDPSGTRRRGHPIVLASHLREAVMALEPSTPLHDLVRSSALLEVPVDDPGVLLDVDTPEDLARAAQLLESGAPGVDGAGSRP